MCEDKKKHPVIKPKLPKKMPAAPMPSGSNIKGIGPKGPRFSGLPLEVTPVSNKTAPAVVAQILAPFAGRTVQNSRRKK